MKNFVELSDKRIAEISNKALNQDSILLVSNFNENKFYLNANEISRCLLMKNQKLFVVGINNFPPKDIIEVSKLTNGGYNVVSL